MPTATTRRAGLSAFTALLDAFPTLRGLEMLLIAL
jgi:hypothetical protein